MPGEEEASHETIINPVIALRSIPACISGGHGVTALP